MSTVAKRTVVQEVKDLCLSNEMVFFVDFKGVSVAAERALRKELRIKEASMRVAKARLIKIALKDLGSVESNPVLNDLIGGQIALVFSKLESQFVAKSLTDFQRKFGRAVFVVGGLYKDVLFDKAKVVGLSKLPSRQVIIQRLANILTAPLTTVARAIKEVSEKI
jgi:large subunit ribosomal protein L10